MAISPFFETWLGQFKIQCVADRGVCSPLPLNFRRHRRKSFLARASMQNEMGDLIMAALAQTKSWPKLFLTAQKLLAEIQAYDAKKRKLLQPQPGGSRKGRKIIKRDFGAAYETLMLHYFGQNPLYCDALFKKRFRVSKDIFMKVYNGCCSCHPYFHHRQNAAGLWGIHPLVKVTAVFRHFAYGIAADSLDEYLQMSETSVLDAREAFCDVRSLCYHLFSIHMKH